MRVLRHRRGVLASRVGRMKPGQHGGILPSGEDVIACGDERNPEGESLEIEREHRLAA